MCSRCRKPNGVSFRFESPIAETENASGLQSCVQKYLHALWSIKRLLGERKNSLTLTLEAMRGEPGHPELCKLSHRTIKATSWRAEAAFANKSRNGAGRAQLSVAPKVKRHALSSVVIFVFRKYTHLYSYLLFFLANMPGLKEESPHPMLRIISQLGHHVLDGGSLLDTLLEQRRELGGIGQCGAQLPAAAHEAIAAESLLQQLAA